MKCGILLPDVVIKESGLYGVREVQALVPMKQRAAAGKWKFVFQCSDSQCNIADQLKKYLCQVCIG